MKKFLLAPLFALSLSGCGLFGVSPEDSEAARSKAERIVVVAELATSFANVAAVKYAALPPCGGAFMVCQKPNVAAALTDAAASLSARLADVRAALASGLDDGARFALITDALAKAAEDLNRILAQVRNETAPAARSIGA